MLRTLVLSIGAVCLSQATAFAQVEKVSLAGRVLDEVQRPVPHTLVEIRDHTSRVQAQTKTDRAGHYTISCPVASTCDLQVTPPLKAGLAQAFLRDLPAVESRHLVVTLHKGFEIHGRVVCDGRPLSAVKLLARAEDGDTVHGGGITTTTYRGDFVMVLSAGNKVFEISDGRTVNAGHVVPVTRDGTIPDLWVRGDLAGKP